MKKSTLSRVFWMIVVLVALGLLPQRTFAQRGGHGGGGGGGFHGGGGGFHGGGGGFHGGAVGGFHGSAAFHGGSGVHYGSSGGRYYGGYRGGGYGWRGGYGRNWGYGWHGRYWGYPRYGWGFGWPYWGWGWGYPYAYYGYPWWTPSSYYYPYYPPDYGYDNGNGNDDPPPADPPRRPNAIRPAYPEGSPMPDGTTNTDHGTNNAALTPRAPILSVDRMNATPSNYRVAQPATHRNLAPRPELQRAMRALREMPPYARQREIETGRYSHLSSKDKEFLRIQQY